jgi:hypothetical protein
MDEFRIKMGMIRDSVTLWPQAIKSSLGISYRVTLHVTFEPSLHDCGTEKMQSNLENVSSGKSHSIET